MQYLVIQRLFCEQHKKTLVDPLIYAGAECDGGAVLPRACELAVPPQHGQGGCGHGAAAGARLLLQTSVFSHVWYEHFDSIDGITITLILHLYQT